MPPRRRSRRTNDFAMEVADLQRATIILQKNLLSKIRDVGKAWRYADMARSVIELSRRVELQVQRVDEFNTRDVLTTFSTCDLFTDGPEAYIPPSSGNPIYDDYEDESYSFSGISDYVSDDGAGEIEFSPDFGDPIYDDYCDDEDELTPSFGEPIYDVYSEDETHPTPSFDTRTHTYTGYKGEDTEDLVIAKVQLPLENSENDVRQYDNERSKLGGFGFVGDNKLLLLWGLRSSIANKPINFILVRQAFCTQRVTPVDMFDSLEILELLDHARHSTFGWKPGWRQLTQTLDSRTNLFCPERMMRPNNEQYIGLIGLLSYFN